MRFIKAESGNLIPVGQVTRLGKVKGPENFYTVYTESFSSEDAYLK